MQPSEFLEVAKLIGSAGGPHPEARQRSAVSRAYYAAFLEARDRVRAQSNIIVPQHRAHDRVCKALLYGNTPLKVIGRLLQDLKKMREASDYDMLAAPKQGDVAEALRMAADVRSALSTADLSKCGDPDKGPMHP